MSLMFAKYKPLPESQVAVTDFTGGLDYSIKGVDGEAKHSPDALNVDWSPSGGWASRRVCAPFNAEDLASKVTWMGWYEDETGKRTVIVTLADGSIRGMDGKGLASYEIKAAGGGVWRGVEANFKFYLMDGTSAPLRWDGTTLTPLAQGWSNTYGTITNGNMPIASYAVVFHNRLIIADLTEGGVRHRNRVRISHPLNNLKGQEDWREADYFEADIGAEGDVITGLKVCGSRCFVFKDHATYEFTGWDTDSGSNLIRLDPLDREVGAIAQESISALGNECYFWDSRQGAQRITEVPNSGGRFIFVDGLMNPLRPLLENKLIPPARNSEVTCGTVGRRVYYSVPWTEGKRTFVFDADMNTWTKYNLQLGPFTIFDPKNQDSYYLAVNQDPSAPVRVLALGLQGDGDDFGSVKANFDSYVWTPNIHGEIPFVNKVWLFVDGVIEGVDVVLPITVTTDFDRDSVLGRGEFAFEQTLGSFPLGSVQLAPTQYEQLVPGGALIPIPQAGEYLTAMLTPDDRTGLVSARLKRCSAKAVSLLIRGPSVSRQYSVRGLNLKYRVSARM